MEIKSILPDNEKDILKPLYSFALACMGAFSSEILFRGFLPEITLMGAIGRIAIVSMCLFVIHRFSLEALRSYNPRLKDLIALTAVLAGTIFMISAFRFISISLVTYVKTLNSPTLQAFANSITPDCLYFAIPYAAGGLLIQTALGLQFGLVFGVGLALIIGVYFPDNLVLPPFVIATTFIGCLGMARFRTRSAYVKAGANVSILALLFAFAEATVSEQTNFYSVMFTLISALVGGMLCSFVVAGIAPVIEHIGGYVTDMTLLEIATLDHPLLKQLSVQAPGTWNHSMVMGMMTESAAQAIGANPILTRVACYYHDIGKTKNPLYFVENQGRGENRHDKLSPSMSALIIRSHVKDGIKMAKEHKLPHPVIDMIPQHHGTSTIEYFYDKACKEAEESGEGEEVDKTLYTYPGPKPQTKEAGIIMLADGIEAAARTISEPSHDRIQGLVQKMINKVFASGELAECELTLKELHEIARCFTHVLSGIYHQRVQYSAPAEKVSEKAEIETEAEKVLDPVAEAQKAKREQDQIAKEKKVKAKKASKESKAKNGSKDEEKVDGKPQNGKSEEQASGNKADSDNKEDLKRLGI